MKKDVYVVYGRIDPCYSVWGFDGETYFEESPLLEIFENYNDAKEFYLKCINESFLALKEYLPEEDFKEQIKHFNKTPLESYTPAKDSMNDYELVTSKNTEIDNDNESIYWMWFVFNWDESYNESPILPCIILRKQSLL